VYRGGARPVKVTGRLSRTEGWPYGLAGSSGHLYRCGKLPIFAVAESLRSGGIAEAVTHVVWNSRLQQLKESPDIDRD